MTEAESFDLIRLAKDKLTDRMVILGHHYQRDEIIQFADYSGDSLELSQIAARQKEVEYIVFCGVHFMAESADILTTDKQKVLLPDLTAGCSMADMAEIDQVEWCWQYLQEHVRAGRKIVPISYVNSSAAIKAFCGRNDGICCTSSNCRRIFESVWDEYPKAVILFLPDQHLGRNTAYEMGVKLNQMALWNPFEEGGGLGVDQIKASQMILWDGFCSVHQEFKAEHIDKARAEIPGLKVIVHPECCFEVAQRADDVGSTAYIIKAVRASERGSRWVVGTETNLVHRLAEEMAEKDVVVRSLSQCACQCETMYRIDPKHLAWLLDMLGKHVEEPEKVKLMNQITVPEEVKKYARVALQKMLEVTSANAGK